MSGPRQRSPHHEPGFPHPRSPCLLRQRGRLLRDRRRLLRPCARRLLRHRLLRAGHHRLLRPGSGRSRLLRGARRGMLHEPEALIPMSTQASPDLAQTYQALRRPLLAYLRRRVGDADAAEDLLHDVMLKAMAALRSDAAPPRNLAAWLHRVAHNAAMDHHRASRPLEPLHDDDAETLANPEPDAAHAAAELADCLQPLIAQLPDTYRDVVRAAELEGRTLREIADAQHIGLDAAKQRASRGRRQLREQLLRCCEVALSAQGQVLDFAPRTGSCAAGCGASRAC